MINNLINFDYSVLGIRGVKSWNMVKAVQNAASAGTYDMYTVPAGKQALVLGGIVLNNGAANATITPKIKISGNYYILGYSKPVNINETKGINNNDQPWFLNTGQIFAVTTSASTFNFWLNIVEFDDTSTINAVYYPGLVSGNNTIYTCPANKKAYITGLKGAGGFQYGNGLIITNETAGNRTYSAYIVPSGGSAGSSNQVFNGVTISTGISSLGNNTFPSATLNAGDFIVVNSDSSATKQLAYLFVQEVPT